MAACPPGATEKSNNHSHSFFSLYLSVQSAMRELIDSGRYDTHVNFTVVLQPFLREVYLPRLEVRAERHGTIKIFFFFNYGKCF